MDFLRFATQNLTIPKSIIPARFWREFREDQTRAAPAIGGWQIRKSFDFLGIPHYAGLIYGLAKDWCAIVSEAKTWGPSVRAAAVVLPMKEHSV